MSNFLDLMDLDESETTDNTFRPIWTINLNDKEEVHSWVIKEYKYLMKINQFRHQQMMEHLLIYKGDQFSPDDNKTINDFLDISRRPKRNKNQRLIINHLFDLTETRVSRSTRNSPQPEVLPANSNELSDRNAAKSSQQILNYLAFINRLSVKDIQLNRRAYIFGESYTTNLWNKDLGDIHPLWLEAKERNFLNEDDTPIEGLDPKEPLMTGEVEVKLVLPWRMLLEEKDSFNEVNHCFVTDVRDVDELKKDYPKSAEEMKPLEAQIFDSNILRTRKLRNETLEITFFHKKTKYLPKGLEIKFTLGQLLDKLDFRYDHKKLPITRLTDIDIEGVLHGESYFTQTKNIQWRHNQLTSDIITNQRMMSKPKWMVPKGKVDIKALGDSRTIVSFSGRVAPQLVSMSPTPPEVFSFRRELKEDMEQIGVVTGVARRDPPPGVTASVAMRFMSELEAERGSVTVSKHNEMMRDIYEQMLSIAGTFYDASDGRTMRVLGKDQEFEIQSLETANLSKAYDVIIRNVASLAESRSSKEARIFDALDRRPDLLSDEQLIDVLQLGSTDKMTSLLTESLRAAEAENEALLSGKQVPEPAVYEEPIVHWRVHIQRMQSYSLKISANPGDLEGLEQHIWMTEFLMTEKAKENPTFQAKLATLALFPIYYRDGQGFKPSSKEHQTAIVQGQANRGEDITGEIPADDIEMTQAFDKAQTISKTQTNKKGRKK